jgi:hypothetical protein
MKHTKIILSGLMAESLNSFARTPAEVFFNVTGADNQSHGMAFWF